MKELSQKIVNSTHECENFAREATKARSLSGEADKNLNDLRNDLRSIMIKKQINRLTYVIEDHVFLCVITPGDINQDQKFEIFIEPLSDS